MSEIYGVTNWDFDFRDHKLHGDWQAAMGVTVRVPHLSWMSMAGEAKRDYPASISYQSPWWREYSTVEDHFARLNTARTRGKPVVRVGVIQPIESYWLHWGPQDATSAARERMENMFQSLTEWLLFGLIDFDYISESLLPEQCAVGAAPLRVGEMTYDAIIVPGCETLRSTTLDRLEVFQREGDRLIFMGGKPSLEDAHPSERGAKLYEKALHVENEKGAVLAALEDVRDVEIRDESGCRSDYLLYQMREDEDGKWLFIAHAKEPYNKDICRRHEIRLTVGGHCGVEVYDTQTGEHRPMPQRHIGEKTEICVRMYDYDSLLLFLTPDGQGESYIERDMCTQEKRVALAIDDVVPYELSEPNALLLDRAEYALDGAEYRPAEEVLRLDNVCRRELGWQSREESFPQPWAVSKVLHRRRNFAGKWNVRGTLREQVWNRGSGTMTSAAEAV